MKNTIVYFIPHVLAEQKLRLQQWMQYTSSWRLIMSIGYPGEYTGYKNSFISAQKILLNPGGSNL